MSFFNDALIRKHYYRIKPFVPRRLQIAVRRRFARKKLIKCSDLWPIDPSAVKPPAGWGGWPGGKQFALVLTHDVDTCRGREKCLQLLRMEAAFGFCSSFNFVAGDYAVSPQLRQEITQEGFEVGVHGLFHNGDLYKSEEKFNEHAVHINRYMSEWEAVGFRSPCMYHNLDWLGQLDIAYDASTFDTDPFEPQPDGVGTIFPFYVSRKEERGGYVELPYTLPQDFTLFILLNEKNIETWEQKVDWIAERGGMVLLNTHPDYMHFAGSPSYEEYPSDYYREFLASVNAKYGGKFWHVLPKEMASFWSMHYFRAQEPLEEDWIAPGSRATGQLAVEKNLAAERSST